MLVTELAPGLWRWTTTHPDWTPEQGGPEGWEREVSSVYCEAAGDVLLIDPLVPADDAERERFWGALDLDIVRAGTPRVLLTCAWHARSSAEILARYEGARLWAPADGLGELPSGLEATDPFRPGDTLPGGAVAIDATIPTEVLLWLPSHGALVAGDTLLGDDAGGVRLCPESWLAGEDPSAVRAALWGRLAELPVERVLVAHGKAVSSDGRAALARALAA
jgi:glyoxylase-like metal-dependent hydrolase (beta-lactamase superfamily II)